MERIEKALELCVSNKFPSRLFIEALAMVYLGVRPLSLVSLPAELPGGDVAGRRIDMAYRERLRQLEGPASLHKLGLTLRTMGMNTTQRKRFLLRQAYTAAVSEVPAYRTLFAAAATLGLSYVTFEVRPSIHEVYFCREQDSREQLLRLIQTRVLIRQQAWERATVETPYWLLAYPEEHTPKFLRELGELLGYPDCCVNSYVKERMSGGNVEHRAARQLGPVATARGFLPFAFFVKHFFPCRPECPAAVRQGEAAQAALGQASSDLAREYMELLSANSRQVLRCPVDVADHLRSITLMEPPAASPE